MYKDKILGCILGGAIGDALGYPVEFLEYKTIQEYYTKQGIVDFPSIGGLISDDTQMTLFTIDGILKPTFAVTKEDYMNSIIDNIYQSYLDWLATQVGKFRDRSRYKNYCTQSRLLNCEPLYDLRAPGNTCLSALHSGKMGTLDKPINTSKGCGGVMRVAPIGILVKPTIFSDNEVAVIGAKAAAITHGHELGYLPAAMLSVLIRRLIYFHEDILTGVQHAINITKETFQNCEHMDEFEQLINKSISLAVNNDDDIINIKKLGEGWVGDEALAIAIYSALRYQNNFKDGIVCAINHGGDSDSTGAIAGNILGAYLGGNKIPSELIKDLELKNLISDMCYDMCRKI